MDQLTIPDSIAVILPFLATILSSWLNDDGLKPGANALISVGAILIAAIACELLASNFTFSNPTWFIGVLGYVGILMRGDLGVLYNYMVKKSSPLAGLKSSLATPAKEGNK